ncbi:SapB/AmfS family lanthipeptide [Streptomyces sp. Rer75]|nr:SapB/AmfS family lanthipeptide [Streptomyces sp. Rer75]QLH19470.1 SapB/AmfS family lantipeptide [Streptomyces sp. Rer75]
MELLDLQTLPVEQPEEAQADLQDDSGLSLLTCAGDSAVSVVLCL